MPNETNRVVPNLEELRVRADELAVRHEELHRKIVSIIMNDPSVPEDFKRRVIEDERKFQEERQTFNDYLAVNKGKRLAGIDPNTFMPTFEEGETEQ